MYAYRVTKYVICLVLSCSTNYSFLYQHTRVTTHRGHAILVMKMRMRLPWNWVLGYRCIVCFSQQEQMLWGAFCLGSRIIVRSGPSRYVTADQTAWSTTATEEIQERDNFNRTGNMATVTCFAH